MDELKPAKQRTRTQQRVLDGAYLIEVEDPKELLFQHTVLCQCVMPYRNPGDDVLTWDRTNGKAALSIHSGRVWIPRTGQWQYAGLPYGPKPRLIMMFLNTEALRTGSPVVNLEKSLRAFLARLDLDPGGRNVHTVKDQLMRLAAAQISVAVGYSDSRSAQMNTQMIDKFELWDEQDGDRRIRWPAVIELSPRYFAGLQKHGVPLDERAILNLKHNCRALDAYAWLTQRLPRVKEPTLIPWHALQLQFGDPDDVRPRTFRGRFNEALQLALSQYSEARVEPDERGLTVFKSPPPVPSTFKTCSKTGWRRSTPPDVHQKQVEALMAQNGPFRMLRPH
jgi:hypothetical protein